MYDFVCLAQKTDRSKIFTAAVLIWDPFAFFSGIIEIEHGCDRIHPKSVNMVFVEPEQGIGDQKGTHLIAAVVEDKCAPVLLFAQLWIGMGVKVGAVKIVQSGAVFWKMRRDPVKNDADVVLVALINEIHEVFRRAEAAGRGVEPKQLIPPGAVKGKFRDRQEFNMGKTHLKDIRDQLVSQLPVSQVA